MQRAFEFIREISVDGSIHGINHLFGRHRAWVFKLLWVQICVAATVCFVYFSMLSLDEHLIQRPVVTHIHYKTNKQIEFPQVLFCPVMPNQTLIDTFTLESAQQVISFLATFSENQVFAGARHDLWDNMTHALLKYPNLERQWKRLMQLGNPDETIRALYGWLICTQRTLNLLKVYLCLHRPGVNLGKNSGRIRVEER